MKKVKIIAVLFLLFSISSCHIFSPSQMLRTGHKYKFSEFPAEQTIQEYKIAPNDVISFSLATNNGEKLINPVTGGENGSSSGSSFMVEFDGMVKLPVLGRVKIAGLTLRETEKMLEDSYSQYYNKPFVQLKVTNNKVIIFPGGEGGKASVLTLASPNTTLFEAIALSGGITDGKAFRIKLIRGDLKNPQIYLIDLSTLEGMKKANLVLQANDIIYIEPRNRIPEKFMTVVTPYISLLTFILLIYQTVR